MALIKCTECGQDISTEAKMCPHCGKPNTPIVIEQKQKGKNGWKFLLALFVFIIILSLGFNVWACNPSFFYQHLGINPFPQISQSQTHSGQAIPLQEVKNLGYDFYEIG